VSEALLQEAKKLRIGSRKRTALFNQLSIPIAVGDAGRALLGAVIT
jgi:hypothetical protein